MRLYQIIKRLFHTGGQEGINLEVELDSVPYFIGIVCNL